jgi:hypothetical protein
MTARRACKEGGSEVGCNDGPVIGISGEIGVEVKAGVGLVRFKITGSSTATAGVHADIIRTEIITRVKRKGSRKLRSIFNLLSSAVDKLLMSCSGILWWTVLWRLNKNARFFT